jgi:trimeric autotransporter adhesin
MVGMLGIPPAGEATTIVVSPVVDIPTAVSALESAVNSVLALVNPVLTSVYGEVTSVENSLSPYETDAGLSPALLGALVALGLIEAGGTLPLTCSDIGKIEAAIPTSLLGIPISLAQTLGLLPVQAQLVANYVDNVLQTEEQQAIAGLSPAALSLLQVNYGTTFYPTTGSPLVRNSLGYIGLPTLLDVDGSPGLDLCADTEINIGSLTSLISAGSLPSLSSLSSLSTASLTSLGSLASLSLTSLKVQQQISKLPLSATTLPVDVNATLPNLGGLGFGYLTKGSSAPQNYATTIQIGSSPLLAYSDTTQGAGPSLTQTVGASGLSLQDTWAPVPASMTTGLNIGSSSTSSLALSFPNTVSSPSDWTFNLPISGASVVANVNELTPSATASMTTLGIPGAGIDASYSAPGGTAGGPTSSFNANIGTGTENLTIGVNPLPTSFDSCTLLASIACSNVTSERTLTGDAAITSSISSSMHFTASSPATTTQSILGTSCSTTLAQQYAQVYGTDVYSDWSLSESSSTLADGQAWLDTAGTPISGCSSGLGEDDVYPAFSATNPGTTAGTVPTPGNPDIGRLGSFSSAGGPAGSLTKSGAVFCASGTSKASLLVSELAILLGGATENVTNWICPTPPVATKVPVITPSSPVYVGSVLSTTSGTFTPTDMVSTTGLQWMRCSSATSCANINGATSSTYAPNSSDVGSTLEVVATNTNTDGSTAATSVQTATVALPPKPVPGSPGPVVTASGPDTATTTAGTFSSPVPVLIGYQWQLCSPTCTNIGGATSNTLTLAPGADQGDTLQVIVTASNAGGSGSSTATYAVPAIPANSAAPFIGDTTQSITNASGQQVSQGDSLVANIGTWTPASGVTFSYQWQHCTTATACSNITGATNATYTVAAADVSDLLQVIVTGTDFSGAYSVTSAQTDQVQPNSVSFQSPVSVVDGTVNASAASDHSSTYVGGSFDTVGPGVGGAGSISVSSATGKDVLLAAGATGGSVLAIAPDGAGGYFIGGTFTAVQGTACSSLAHILPTTGKLDSTYCPSSGTGTVNALDRLPSGVLAVGGLFNFDGGHQNLMFFDNTGAVHASGGDPNGQVNALTDDGNFVYAGGAFTSLATASPTAVNDLAKYAITGTGATITVAPTAWSATVSNCVTAGSKPASCVATGTPGVVDALAVVKDVEATTVISPGVSILYYVIVGGSFNTASRSSTTGSARTNAAAIYGGTSCTVTTTGGVLTPAETPSQVQPNTCTSATTATLGGWAPNPNAAVRSIAVGGIVGESNLVTNQQSAPIYLGGDFTSLGATTTFSGLGEYGLSGTEAAGVVSTSAPAAQQGVTWGASPAAAAPATSWNPAFTAPSGPASVTALTIGSDGNVYAGGNFTALGSATYHRIVQLSPVTTATSSAVPSTTWDPNAGNQVTALAASGTNILVGGKFLVLGGVTRNNLAEIGTNGAVTSWNPGANGPVKAIGYDPGTVYVGGSFSQAGGASRANLAGISTAGAATSWNTAGANGAVDAILTANGTVYVGGAFTQIGGSPQAALAALDPTAGTLSTWTPALSGTVLAIAATSSAVYVGGSLSGGSNAVALNSLSAAPLPWNAAVAGGTVNALAVSGTEVYVGGSFTSAGGSARANLAALDPTLGTAEVGWAPNPNGTVNALALSSDGSTVYLGGSFSQVASANRSNVAGVFTSDGAKTSFNPGANGAVDALTLSTVGGSDTLTVGGAFSLIGVTLTGGFAIF